MRKRLVVAIPVVLLIVLAVLLTNLFPFRQMLAADRAVASAATELDGQLDDNALLEAELAALQTASEVERVARDELGYVFPGERAFVVVAPDEEVANPTRSEIDQPLPEPRPWYAPIVDFLTGRDLG